MNDFKCKLRSSFYNRKGIFEMRAINLQLKTPNELNAEIDLK